MEGQFRWWIRWSEDSGEWARCEPGDPGALELVDTDRLKSGEATWSQEQRRWVLKRDEAAATPVHASAND